MVIGKIDYLNLLPFHIFIKKNGIKVIEKKGYPAQINRLFENRVVESAFISSIKSKNKNCLDAGIIANKKVLSVLICENKENLQDKESETSNQLAKILNLKGEVIIGDKALQKFYNENKDLYFKSEPKFKARHIVVKDETLARKLIKELKGLRGKSLESKFAKLAKKYSTGPSKVQGGELGWFDPNQMVPEFSKACANLSEGEITLEPVKTRFGYHIILLEGKDSKNYIPLAKVKRQIIEYLKREKLQKELKRIKNSYKVKYLIPKN